MDKTCVYCFSVRGKLLFNLIINFHNWLLAQLLCIIMKNNLTCYKYGIRKNSYWLNHNAEVFAMRVSFSCSQRMRTDSEKVRGGDHRFYSNFLIISYKRPQFDIYILFKWRIWEIIITYMLVLSSGNKKSWSGNAWNLQTKCSILRGDLCSGVKCQKVWYMIAIQWSA